MSKIHRPPRGLQHLLGSQSFGQNPDQLAQIVQPTIEMSGFYGAELLKNAVDTTAVAGSGQVGSITFQAPVAIVCVGVSNNIGLGTVENCNFAWTIDGLGGVGTPVGFRSSGYQQYEIGNLIHDAFMFPYPLHVPGGATIECYLNSQSAFAVSTFQTRVAYVDLNPIDDV